MVWDIVGQERAVAALRRDLSAARPAHAYLFVGPPQVGKATLALRLAQALNCLDNPAGDEPCGHCNACRRIASDLHADVMTIGIADAADDGGPAHKEIRISQIREVEQAISLSPYEGRYRVVVVDPADAMNEEAQNAFLKTLEEPPPHVVIVLITAAEDALLPTIRSRCRRLELTVLPVGHVEAALRDYWAVEPAQARLLARLSEGRLGWARAALDSDQGVLAARQEAIQRLREVVTGDRFHRFSYAADLAAQFSRNRAAVLASLDLWTSWWRDVLLAQSGCFESIVNIDMADVLRSEAGRYQVQDVVSFLEAVRTTRRHLENNVNPRLALEVLMLSLPRAVSTHHDR